MTTQLNPKGTNRSKTRQRRRNVRLPDGGEIVRRRLHKGWSQEDLAGEILRLRSTLKVRFVNGARESTDRFKKNKSFSEKWPLRTVQKAEQGIKHIELPILELIAKALGCTVQDIILEGDAFRLAMMDEVFSSADGKLGKPAGVFWRLLQALESKADDRSRRAEFVDEQELLLALAIRRDISGDADGAARLGELLLSEARSTSTSIGLRAAVRLATFYDHVGQPARGWEIINRVKHRTGSPQTRWAQLQRGILYFRLGRIRSARRTLERLRASAPDTEHATAALHQLSVIEMVSGRLQEAKRGFEQCLEERLKQFKQDFRLAYEYSRLSQVCDALDQPTDAKIYRRKADNIINLWSFARYERHHSGSDAPRRRVKRS
jgi:transcriptional regulator with XRE-family HTH domain